MYTVDSCNKTPPLSPTNPPPHVKYDVILTRLDIGVSVRPVENGQLHQLHFLQVVLPLSLHQHMQSSTISFWSQQMLQYDETNYDSL